MGIQESLKKIISLGIAGTCLVHALRKVDTSNFTPEEKTGMNMLPLMILASLIEIGFKDTAKRNENEIHGKGK